MKKKIGAVLENDTYQAMSESFAGVMFSGLFAQIVFLAVAFITERPFALLQILAFGFTMALFFMFKDSAKPSHRSIGLFIFKLSPLIMISAILFGFILQGVNSLPIEIQERFGMPQIIIVGIALFAGYFMIISKQKDRLASMAEEPVISKMAGKEVEVEEGDMVIGHRINVSRLQNGEKEYEYTDNKVVLKKKSRYMHMLIIGPTGSGKTSRILIPQIIRDIQVKDMGVIVLEPKGDLAEQVYAMGEYFDRDDVMYFNPVHPECPIFNPLVGPEPEVVENMVQTFSALSGGSKNPYFDTQGEILLRRSITLLKRLYGDDATLLHLSDLIHNTDSKGRDMVIEFSKMPMETNEIQKENDEITHYFLSDYLTGSNPANSQGATDTYKHTSNMRNQVAKLVSNKYLRRVLNPPVGQGTDIDFDKILAEGQVVSMTIAQGQLRALAQFLGFFLILQLQSAVFRRPGNEDTRGDVMLFIDEFQKFSNPDFEDMLTQARSYRVAVHLATQAKGQISDGTPMGRRFLEAVEANARNVVVFPGISAKDAKAFSDEFGEEMVQTKQIGTSKRKTDFVTWSQHKPTNISERTDERFTARITPTDIMQRPADECTFGLLGPDGRVEEPGFSKLHWIPWELKQKLDAIVESYAERGGVKPHEKDANSQRVGNEIKNEIKENQSTNERNQSNNSQMNTPSTPSNEESARPAINVDNYLEENFDIGGEVIDDEESIEAEFEDELDGELFEKNNFVEEDWDEEEEL